MPRTLAVTPVEMRLQLARAQAAASNAPEDLQRLPRSEILARQAANGLGCDWGVIRFQREWLPPGSAQATPDVDIRKSLLNQAGVTPDRVEAAVLVVSRLALIYFLLPQPSKNTRVMWKPSTVVKRIEAACRLAGRALCLEGSDQAVFSRITVSPTGAFNWLHAVSCGTRHLTYGRRRRTDEPADA